MSYFHFVVSHKMMLIILICFVAYFFHLFQRLVLKLILRFVSDKHQLSSLYCVVHSSLFSHFLAICFYVNLLIFMQSLHELYSDYPLFSLMQFINSLMNSMIFLAFILILLPASLVLHSFVILKPFHLID